jgi:hypothetical protein
VIHPALYRAGAPGHGQAVGDGVEVVLQSLGERRDARRAGVAGGGDPLRDVLAGEVGDHGGEGADLAGCRVRFGAAVQDGLELGAFVPGQVVRAAAEPVRDVPDGWRGLAERCLFRAGAVGVAAVVAEGLDLMEQAGEAAVSAVGVPAREGSRSSASASCSPPSDNRGRAGTFTLHRHRGAVSV